jgi:hypothetical protein
MFSDGTEGTEAAEGTVYASQIKALIQLWPL